MNPYTIANQTTCPFARVGLALLFSLATIWLRADDTVALGYPLDYKTTSALFPGLGEAPGTVVVPRLGQTFAVPAGHPYLTTFSFWLADSPVYEPQPTTFNAVLMAYGTDRPVGQVLYQSGARNTAGLAHGEVRRFDFTVGVSLVPLANYIFFLDTAPYLEGVPSYATFAGGGDVYSGGTLVSSQSTTGLDHAPDNPWQPGGLGWDVVFRAEFAAVPEPSTICLMLAIAIPFSIRLSRRRQ